MYKFYFDESFHDRKVVIKEKVINTLTENNIDTYIGFFWGAKDDIADKTILKFQKLDNKFKERLGLQGEFKGVTFNRKNFKHGIKTFNKDCFDFYSQLFNLLNRDGIIFQYDTISKIEYLLQNILNLNSPINKLIAETNGYSIELFTYSLSKFIYTYQNNELIAALYNVQNRASAIDFKNCIVSQLATISKAIKHIERKEAEFHAFQQLIIVINNLDLQVSDEKTFDFTYVPNFMGLTRLLKELSIKSNKISLYIDNEEKTLESAKLFQFKDVTCVDSSSNAGTRISDFLSNFIGRFMYAMINDDKMREDKVENIRDITKNDLKTKRLLSDEWFDLSKEQFDLYYKIAQILIINHQHYWTLMTGNYFDNAVLFVELFKFFYYCGDYDKYCRMNKSLIKEYFNSQVCETLLNQYQRRWEKKHE